MSQNPPGVEPIQRSSLSGPTRVFFNAVAVVLAARLLHATGQVELACVHPAASSGAIAVILLALVHVVWRYLSSEIKRLAEKTSSSVVVEIAQVLDIVSGVIHPTASELSLRMLWLLCGVTSIVAIVLGLCPRWSPFRIQDEPPTIKSFSVFYIDKGETVTKKPGETVEVAPGATIRVEADLSPRAVSDCEWRPEERAAKVDGVCATRYTAPLREVIETLSLLAKSPCEKREAYYNLGISVTHARASQ